MIYQYDQALQLPTVDLYDTQMMAMALNAAKDMYERGEQQIKDFQKAYGDFITPILADQEYYNKNVTGRVRDAVNNIYARGGDPLRNARDRAELSMLINNMPYGDIAKLRSSAKNAEAYLAARRELEAKGLFNPMFAKYDAPDMSTYSTLNDGIWDKMSPTRMTDVATFGNPYFEGMKPNIHKESKNGVSYSVESITEKDLKNIADAHFNELVSTPQGQLMFKYYRDLAGGDSNPRANEEAREMFNNAVSDAQRRRIYIKDDYDDRWKDHQQMALAWSKNAREAEQWDIEKKILEKQLAGLGGDQDIPTAGASDQVALDQSKQYNKVREDYEKQIRDNEQNSYNALTENRSVSEDGGIRRSTRSGERVIADRYKKALSTISDPNATKAEKDKAAQFIAKWDEEGSANFKKWTKDYRLSIDKTAWNKYRSSIAEDTDWGKEQSEMALYNKAHEAFERQNILRSQVDTGIQKDLNSSIALIDDGNGNQVGNVTSGTDFAPIIEAAVTGNRRYKYNSDMNKINRVIKGKSYKVTSENQVGRKYGSGSIKNARYDMIRQTATFDDPDVKSLLDKYTEEGLNSIGITKNEDGSYNIPIISKYSKGSQTWADVNTETDKRIGGQSEAVKRRATRQASSIRRDIQ